jgi:hypothetical protein
MEVAGLARALLVKLSEQPDVWTRARLLVRGGGAAPSDFDAWLQARLLALEPAFDLARLEIVHLPTEHVCPACAERFETVDPTVSCPACGVQGRPHRARLDIQLEVEAE